MARARFAALLPLGAQDAGDGGPDAPATTTSAAQIIVEPSDDAQALLTSIQSATKSIHILRARRPPRVDPGRDDDGEHSLDSNRELGLLVSASSEVAKVEARIDGDFNASVVY